MKKATVYMESNYYGATEGRECKVLKSYFFNGEGWLVLEDLKTGERFESPDIFWDVKKVKA